MGDKINKFFNFLIFPWIIIGSTIFSLNGIFLQGYNIEIGIPTNTYELELFFTNILQLAPYMMGIFLVILAILLLAFWLQDENKTKFINFKYVFWGTFVFLIITPSILFFLSLANSSGFFNNIPFIGN